MGVFRESAFWYAVAATISAGLIVVFSASTLRSKKSKRFTFVIWGVAILLYFCFVYSSYLQNPSAGKWDYFLFLGRITIILIPVFLLYREHLLIKSFTAITGIFFANVTSFITRIITKIFINDIKTYGEEKDYLTLIKFVGIRLLITVAAIFFYIIFLRKLFKKVYDILEDKKARFLLIPCIASIGFFVIVRIVQSLGLIPKLGVVYIGFYTIICLLFVMMYWLVFSNVLWASRAMKTQAELSIASNIQKNMLPRIRPSFMERSDFDIYAMKESSKEVGGDFYDFFLVDNSHLAIVISAVSGKGVPAALFMVIAKIVIRNRVNPGESLGDIFASVNNQLCENNGEGMFITSFMGILDLKDGTFRYVNAGHNQPLIRHGSGRFESLRTQSGFVLAGMENLEYVEEQIQLDYGDTVFLYTDGVIKAINNHEELFTEEQLTEALNEAPEGSVKDLLKYVKNKIDTFANGADQYDDITMLGMKYLYHKEESEKA